jgi:hypothetical protein
LWIAYTVRKIFHLRRSKAIRDRNLGTSILVASGRDLLYQQRNYLTARTPRLFRVLLDPLKVLAESHKPRLGRSGDLPSLALARKIGIHGGNEHLEVFYAVLEIR